MVTGQCSSVIVVISSLLGDNRGAPSGWRIIHSNNNNAKFTGKIINRD